MSKWEGYFLMPSPGWTEQPEDGVQQQMWKKPMTPTW